LEEPKKEKVEKNTKGYNQTTREKPFSQGGRAGAHGGGKIFGGK